MWALGGVLRYFALAFGTTTSIFLACISWVVLINVSKKYHVVYNFAAFSSAPFRHFLLVVASFLAVVTLAALCFLWAFVKNLRDNKEVDDLAAYLKYKRRKREAARMTGFINGKPVKTSPLVTGAASILDFRNTLTPSLSGLTPDMQDYLAIKSDWAAVGNDLQSALNKAGQEINQEKEGIVIGNQGRSA